MKVIARLAMLGVTSLLLQSCTGVLTPVGDQPADAPADGGLEPTPEPRPVPGNDAGVGADACLNDLAVGDVPAQPPVPGNWEVTFFDDFQGSTLDSSRWKVGEDWLGFNGRGAWDPKTVSVGCGVLSIRAERRPASLGTRSADYATAEVSTFKRFRQRYGYFEARVRYDAVQGLWPAFWLMPDRGKYGDESRNRRSYLKFDVSELQGADLSEVILELTVVQVGPKLANVAVYAAEDSWSEAVLSGSTQPSHDPLWLAIQSSDSWSPGDRIRVNVTEYVKQEAASDQVASFLLADEFTRQVHLQIASREHPEAANHPVLIADGRRIEANADASVAGGEAVDQRLGETPTLEVFDDWGNATSTYGGGMEFDILEALGHWGLHRNKPAIHWDGYGRDHKVHGLGLFELGPTEHGFHVYGFHWWPGAVSFYADGEELGSFRSDRVASVPEYIIVSLQLGGWRDDYGDNRIVDDERLPAGVDVDYVRVWRDASGP